MEDIESPDIETLGTIKVSGYLSNSIATALFSLNSLCKAKKRLISSLEFTALMGWSCC